MLSYEEVLESLCSDKSYPVHCVLRQVRWQVLREYWKLFQFAKSHTFEFETRHTVNRVQTIAFA